MSDDYKVLTGKFFIDFHGNGKPVEVVERSELEAMQARAEAAERLAQFASGDGWNELPKLREKIAELEAKLKIADEYIPVLREKNGRLREKVVSLGEALSYLPKVPTQPYEKEMAKQILKLEAERDEWKSKYEASEWVRKDTALRTYDGLTVEIDQLRRENEGLETALKKIGSADHPSMADKTSWIVMTESICALAREAIAKFGGKK